MRQWGYDLGVDYADGLDLAAPKILTSVETITSGVSKAFSNLLEDFKSDFVIPFLNKFTDELTPAVENFFFGVEGYEADWGTFWGNIWDSFKTYISNIIAKLIIAVPLMLIWGALTGGISWALLGTMWNFLGFEQGGGVGYNKGGEVKKFQSGGMADTIPARLTIGEYVIAKPMTDFIKRFKAIPQNLVDAIIGGFPTPIPSFASGGPVGTSNINSSSFGESKIYVDIHDNRISDDVDIRHLANTVGNEVLKKIKGNRRF